MCDILGVEEVMEAGKYLGVPMRVGKNKNETFNFIRDRVSQKLQGWGHRQISKAGKLILLKSAAQSLPNFWMSLFLIPKEISSSIQRQMNCY